MYTSHTHRGGHAGRITAAVCLAFAVIATIANAASASVRVHWKREGQVDRAGLNALDCPTTHLCVGVGYSDIAVTTDPAGPARRWKVSAVDRTTDPNGNPSDLQAVGCASAAACVTGDDSQNGWFSPAPAASGWGAFTFPSDTYVSVEAIGCSPLGNCTALSVDGREMSTPALSAASLWSFVSLPHTDPANPDQAPAQISCPGRTCVIAWDDSGVWATTNAGGSFVWVPIPHSTEISEVNCPRVNFCIAGSEEAVGSDLWISRDPAKRGSWHAVKVPAFKSAGPSAVACPSTGLCIALDGTGSYSSTRPSSGGSWKADASRAVWGGIGSELSCPSAHLCVGSDQFGDIAVATF